MAYREHSLLCVKSTGQWFKWHVGHSASTWQWVNMSWFTISRVDGRLLSITFLAIKCWHFPNKKLFFGAIATNMLRRIPRRFNSAVMSVSFTYAWIRRNLHISRSIYFCYCTILIIGRWHEWWLINPPDCPINCWKKSILIVLRCLCWLFRWLKHACCLN